MLFCVLASLCLFSCGEEKELSVCSPDGNIRLNVNADNQVITYSVESIEKGKTAILLPSKLGFLLAGGDSLNRFVVNKTEHASFDETWEQPWGESRLVRNHYNELKVYL